MILIGVFIVSFVYSLFVKKRFKFFLQKANKNPLLRDLLKEISSQNISLVPFGFSTEFLFGRNCSMLAYFFPKKIAISNKKIIKKFIEKEKKEEFIQEIALKIAHELGHLNESVTSVRESFEERRRVCKIKTNCLCDELLATKMGIKILERITGKRIEEVIPPKVIRHMFDNTLIQCEKCLFLLPECPKIQRVLKEIKSFLDISNNPH